MNVSNDGELLDCLLKEGGIITEELYVPNLVLKDVSSHPDAVLETGSVGVQNDSVKVKDGSVASSDRGREPNSQWAALWKSSADNDVAGWHKLGPSPGWGKTDYKISAWEKKLEEKMKNRREGKELYTGPTSEEIKEAERRQNERIYSSSSEESFVDDGKDPYESQSSDEE